MTNDEIVVLSKDNYKMKSGTIFKNYKELCHFMEWKSASGNTKIAQFKILDTLCKWHKEGQKIIIDEVYSNPLEKVDGRKMNFGTKKRKLSNILFNYLNTSGVYLITDKYGKQYIGSSKNIYRRFIEHKKKGEPSRSRFLDKGSMEMTVFEFTRGIEDREFLYNVESIIIEESFKLGMNLTNERNKKSYEKRVKEENLLKNIKVKKNDYQKALEILRENGIVA